MVSLTPRVKVGFHVLAVLAQYAGLYGMPSFSAVMSRGVDLGTGLADSPQSALRNRSLSREKINLKQLAQELGLSQTTVSRALNGFPEVSERTREAVSLPQPSA